MEKDNHKWHGAHHYSDKLHFAFILFLVFGIIVLLFGYFFLNSNNFSNPSDETASITPVLTPTPTPTPTRTGGDLIACTQDVKECSDGSFVGRVAPNCEFAKCPE